MPIYTAILTYRVNNLAGNNERSRVDNIQVNAISTDDALSKAMGILSMESPALVYNEVNVWQFDDIKVNPPQ